VNGNCGQTGGAMNRQTCVSGAYCDPADDICKARKAQGTTCAESEECLPMLGCQNGTCNPLAKLDDTCNTSDFGMGQPDIACQLGLRCDFAQLGSPGVCKLRAQQGEDCWLTIIDCADGLFCEGTVFTPPQSRGTCQMQRVSGASCQSQDQCADGLYCGGGMCTDKKAQGAACGSQLECQDGLACSGGMCRPATCRDPTP
jgi:hypothetical protein